MPRQKTYKSNFVEKDAAAELDLRIENANHSAVIEMMASSKRRQPLDLSQWLGRGFNDWVYGAAEALSCRMRSGAFSEATIVSLATVGAHTFFKYLAEGQSGIIPTSPAKLTSAHVDRYVAWLRGKYPGSSTARAYFSQIKSLVNAMHEIGLTKVDASQLFPANPFPGTRAVCQGDTPLSATEMQRLSDCLKKDLIAIHNKSFKGTDPQALSVFVLLVAMRLGANTTSVLEMRRDCLRPHPIMPNLMVVDTVKRRASGPQVTGLRKVLEVETAESISMDGVAIIRKVLSLTESVSVNADGKKKNQLWIYESPKHGPKNNKVITLSESVLGSGIRQAMSRHNIYADDGTPLRVTLSRLRKTKETRLWRLSDGDLLAVAATMGHSPQVADNHYLRLDEDAKQRAVIFIAKELPAKLRGEGLSPTPTGRCEDTLNGSFAPKDGSTHCANFTQCLSCPNYAIAGTVDDLHRLYSFQAFLAAELASFEGEEWHEWHNSRKSMINQIDEFSIANFPVSIIDKAREKTKISLHPFWEIQMRRQIMEGA